MQKPKAVPTHRPRTVNEYYEEMRLRGETPIFRFDTVVADRYAPCKCGSGKKFKFCCGGK